MLAQRRRVWRSIPFDPLQSLCYGRNRCWRPLFQPVTSENLPGQPSLLSFFAETGTDRQGRPRHPPFLFLCLVGDHLRQVHPPPPGFPAVGEVRHVLPQVQALLGGQHLRRRARRHAPDDPVQGRLRRARRPGQGRSAPTTPRPPRGGTSGKLLIKNISGIERALERAIGVEMSRLTRYDDLPRHDRLGLPVHRPLRHGLGHHAVVPRDRHDRLDLDRRGRARHLRGPRSTRPPASRPRSRR